MKRNWNSMKDNGSHRETIEKQMENHWQGLPAVEKQLENKGKTVTATKKQSQTMFF